MPSTYDGRSRSRPLGITILCVLGFIGTFFSSIGMLGVLGRGGPFAIVGLVGLALVAGKAVVLFGLWTLEEWGYRWAIRLYALAAVLDLITLSFLSLLFDALIVAYIASKADHFR